MKEKDLTVSIGITAYNEQDNVQSLLRFLQSQKTKGFVIESIVVLSDGSTDQTVKSVELMTDERIKVISNHERKGKAHRLNQFFELSNSDIVVTLDADIVLANDYVISNLIQPFLNNTSIAYVSGKAKPMRAENLLQRIIEHGVLIWSWARESTKNSEMYFSEGSIRAFKNSLYRHLKFPETSADDAYPFLFCKKNNCETAYSSDALVFFSMPRTYADYFRQTVRFLKSPKIHTDNFTKDFIKKYFVISTIVKVKTLFVFLIKKPILTSLYLLFLIPPKLYSYILRPSAKPVWQIASSTKQLKQVGKPMVVISSFDDLRNPYYGGGGAVAVHAVAKRLVSDFDVTVITGTYHHAINETVDGVSYKRVGTKLFGPKIGQLLFQFQLPFLVLTKTFDVWVESFTPPFSTAALQLFTKKPVIGLAHMLSGQDMLRKYRIPFDIIEKIGLKMYKDFIVLTDHTKELIESINTNANISVVPNGVDMPDIKSSVTKKHILFIGRIEVDQKGIDLLLEAYSMVADKIPFDLVIAGTGQSSELKKLSSLILRYKLVDRIKLVGKVNGDKKDELFSLAAFTVMPSRYETFSLVALESLSYGLPVLSFDIPGCSWANQKLLCKVPSFDLVAYSEAMITLSTNEKIRKEFFDEARKFITGYSWDHAAEKYREVINQVLARTTEMTDEPKTVVI